MIIEFKRLEEHSGQLFSEETVKFEDPFERETAVKCRVEVSYQRNGGTYFFHGDVAGDFRTMCHRCLDEVPQAVSGDFDLVVRRGGARDEPESSGVEDNYLLLSLTEQEVSLDDYIYESLIVNIPMQIVCKEDCRGLCHSCGINLNRESCTCDSAPDPRWDALRKLGKKPAE